MKTDSLLIIALPIEAGFIAGAAAGSFAALYQAAQHNPEWAIMGGLTGTVAFGLGAGAALVWLADTWRNHINPPPAPVVQVQEVNTRLMVTMQANEGGPSWAGRFLDVEIEEDRLIDFAAKIAASGVGDLSLAQWAGPRKMFSRSEFEALRYALIQSNYARWNNARSHQRGAALTGSGRALFRHLARRREGDTPPQRGYSVVNR